MAYRCPRISHKGASETSFSGQNLVVGFSCDDPRIGQDGCWVLFSLAAEAHGRVDHFAFASFFLGCAYGYAFAYLANRRSAESIWYFVVTFLCRLPHSFADSRVTAIVEAVFRLQREMEAEC